MVLILFASMNFLRRIRACLTAFLGMKLSSRYVVIANARSHLRRIIKCAGDILVLAFKVIAVIEVKVVVPTSVNGGAF